MKKPYNINDFAEKGELKLQRFIPHDQKMRCLCGKEGKNNEPSTCIMCEKSFHECLLQPRNQDGMCCYCISRENDPANIVEQVLNEGFWNFGQPAMYENKLEFEFSARPLEVGCRVDVRCFRAGEDAEGFPMIGTIRLNDREVTVLKPLLSNSNLKKRKDEALTLPEENLRGRNTLSLGFPRISRNMRNTYQVESEKTCYFLGIYLIRRLKRDELEDYVKRESYISKEDSMRKFFTNGDNNISLDGQKQSLKCPLTLEMIQVPVRGTFCTHFQVFCLKSLYATQGEKGRWTCPICRKKIYHPIMDMWVYEITSNSTNTEQDEMELEFKGDGTYKWLKRPSKTKQLLLIPGAKPTLPKRKGRKQEVKVEEEPTYEFDPSSLKRTNEIDLEELEIKTGESRVAVRPVIPDDDDVVIVDDSNKDKKKNLGASNVSNANNPIAKKNSKRPAKSSEDEMVCQIIEQIRPPQRKSRVCEIEEGELQEILPPPKPKPLPQIIEQQPRSVRQSKKADQEPLRAISQPERLKRQLEMNDRYNSSLEPKNIQKIKQSLTTTRCEDMTLHELTRLFEKLRVRKPKRQKLFTDNFPNLFRMHY